MPTSQTDAPRDNNRVTVLTGVSSQTITIDGVDFVEGETPVPVAVDPTTNKIKLEITEA